DVAAVTLMRRLLSYTNLPPEPLDVPQIRRALALMALVRRHALRGASAAARTAAADEAAAHLLRQGRLLLKHSPRASAHLGLYVARLPRHRLQGVHLVVAATRCIA